MLEMLDNLAWLCHGIVLFLLSVGRLPQKFPFRIDKNVLLYNLFMLCPVQERIMQRRFRFKSCLNSVTV